MPRRTISADGGENKKEVQKVGFVEAFVLGGVVGAVSKTVVAPIERVKLLVLVPRQDEMMNAGRIANPYADYIRRVVGEQGFGALWRGNAANVLRYSPTQALNFAFKDYLKNLFGFSREKDGNLLWVSANFASGGLAGAVSLVFMYPLDFSRARMVNNINSAMKSAADSQSKGLLARLRQKRDGIAGLYRGFVVSCVGIVVYRSCYFGFYDSLKPMLLQGEMADSFPALFALGWIVTVAAGLVSYPLDTIRRRVMMTSYGKGKYKSSLDCGVQILTNEGVASLFKGAGANILRGIAGGLVLSGFDKAKYYYVFYRYGEEAADSLKHS